MGGSGSGGLQFVGKETEPNQCDWLRRLLDP